MGCDVHVYVERRYRGKWVLVDPPTELPPGADWRDPEFYKTGLHRDWGAYAELPPPVQELANAGLTFEETVPAVANDWNFGRNYSAFGQLAGVRGGDRPFIEPRGVPEDISPQLFSECWQESDQWGGATAERHGKTYYWGPDWHNPHWYSLRELLLHAKGGEVEKRIRELRDELKKIAKNYKLDAESVRVVFWFDN